MTTTRQPADQTVYEAYWQDGSLDLFAGLGASIIGTAWVLDLVVLGPVAPAIALPLWMVFRRRVIEPRLGFVRFAEARRRQLRRAHLGLIGLGVAVLVLGIAAYFGIAAREKGQEGVLRRLVPALPSFLLGLAAVLSAVMFAIPRLALYAIPFVLGGGVVLALATDPGWGLLIGGAATALTGTALTVSDLRHHPLLPCEIDS